MKHVFIVMILALSSGCVFKPVPVKFDDIKGKDYVLAADMYLNNGPYKKSWAGIVCYDSAPHKKKKNWHEPVYRILVDDKGEPVTFGNQMDLLNFFSQEGWVYVESSKIEIMKNVKRDFMLLEKGK